MNTKSKPFRKASTQKTLFSLLVCCTGLAITSTHAAIVVIDEGLDNSGLNSVLSSSGGGAKAINFVMAAGSDYKLSDVVLGFGSITGTPDITVGIWSDDGTSAPIGSLLDTLTNPTLTPNSANTFTSSGITLEAGKSYWVVAQNTVGNQLEWLGNNVDTSVTSDIGATHTARLFGNAGSPESWTGASSVLNQIQINATAIPEPSTALLGGLGALLLLRRRR